MRAGIGWRPALLVVCHSAPAELVRPVRPPATHAHCRRAAVAPRVRTAGGVALLLRGARLRACASTASAIRLASLLCSTSTDGWPSTQHGRCRRSGQSPRPRSRARSPKRAVQSQISPSERAEDGGDSACGLPRPRLQQPRAGHRRLHRDRCASCATMTHCGATPRRLRKAGGTCTRQLLAFSRQQVLQPSLLDVNKVVSHVEQLLTRLIGEDVELRTYPSDDLWPVKADCGTQLEQVLMNLAVTAMRCETAGCSRFEYVDLTRSMDGEPFVVVAGPYVLLAVTDTGTGMNAETKARAFEPFFTTKPPGQGPACLPRWSTGSPSSRAAATSGWTAASARARAFAFTRRRPTNCRCRWRCLTRPTSRRCRQRRARHGGCGRAGHGVAG